MMRGLAILAALALTWAVVQAVEADSAQSASVRLEAGYSAVTWSGAEPYAIANFEGTPVKEIHRFDAVRQRWLGRVVGQMEVTLPELHLLPRVQYLIVSDEAHELTIPNPLTEIDPLAKLRFPPVPNDPLRFEAYWPNEDSPLEDLVVLRGEDERLSVEAWVAGGEGDVSVWWMIDGRVNYEGLQSDDVELLPGGHDHGRLYAVGASGEVAVVPLPRVVKLPPLELPDMTYGAYAAIGDELLWTDWRNQGLTYFDQNWDAVEKVLDLIKDAGFSSMKFRTLWREIEPEYGVYDEDVVSIYDRLFDEVHERGLDAVVTLAFAVPDWASESDVRKDYFANVVGSLEALEAHVTFMSEQYPNVRYWEIRNEPNFDTSHHTIDPFDLMREIQTAALALWYTNPDNVIITPTLGDSHESSHGPGSGAISLIEFLQDLYDRGLKGFTDIIGFHPYVCPIEEIGHLWTPTARDFEGRVRSIKDVMIANGDTESHLWITETSFSTAPSDDGGVSDEEQAQCIEEVFSIATELDELTGVIHFRFLDDNALTEETGYPFAYYLGFAMESDGVIELKPSYYTIREFLTGQPPPE